MFWGKETSIHLIGIGGSGMSGIAEILLALGIPVSGSDSSETATVSRLRGLGASISIGHRESAVVDPTCVVVSSAIPLDNPELLAARAKRIPVIPRAEMLAELMRLKLGIAIAGSHGKTTTTSMTGQFLRPLDPTVVVGGRLQHWNASSHYGQGAPFVIEADESDRSFLKFSPVYSVVTNIDREHMDTYSHFEDLRETFLSFINRTAFFGRTWICRDCPTLTSLLPRISKPVSTYGFHADSELRISLASFTPRNSFFELIWKGESLGEFELPVVGKHNVQNATAAIGLCLSLGVSLDLVKKAARDFIPADRRLQIHADNGHWAVIEDYGHHPTEIRATLEAVKLMYPERKMIVIFQPHRYSRTQALFDEFAPSLEESADTVILLPIYGAHESPINGVSSEALAKTFTKISPTVLPTKPTAESMLSFFSSPSVCLVLGAGPLTSLAHDLAVECKKVSGVC